MAGDGKQIPDPILSNISSILAQIRTPENAKGDDESSVTERSTRLKSPTRGRNPRASFASPTQASNARRGIVSPSPSTANSPLTSPITSPLTSPVTSSRASSIPRFHRKSRSVETTPKVKRSSSPLDDSTGTTASLYGRLKSSERQSNKNLRAKTSQHKRARSHEHNNILETHNESDERELDCGPWAGPSSRNTPVERHHSYEVQQDIASDAREQTHKDDAFHDKEGIDEATRSEKLEALPRLVVPEEQSSFEGPGPDPARILSTTTQKAPENHAGTQTSPGLNSSEDEDSVLQDELEGLNYQLILENEIGTLNHSLEMKEKDIEARNQALRKQTEMIEALNESLRTATKNMRKTGETLGKLRNDFTELSNAAQHVLRRNIDTKLDPNILKNLSGNTKFSPEAKALYSNFVQIVQKLEFRLSTLSTRSQKHHEDSTTRKENLELLKKELTEMQEREKVAVSEGRKAKEELAIWKQRYEDERKLKEKAQYNYRSFKRTAEEMYQPDLEKKIKELQSRLIVLRYENTLLQERVQTYKARISNWEDEHSITKERAETKQFELEDEIKRQGAEILVYIKEYHEKVKANSHWNVEGLQQRIREMEREHEATIALMQAIEREKSRLEQHTIPKFSERICTLEKENKKLKDEWAMKHHAPSTETATRVPAGLPVPRFMHPEETAKREEKLEKLRQHQLKLRKNRARIDAYAEAMLEKARERVLGPELYEKGEWRNFAGKSSWQIWDGDSWTCVAGKRDFKIVEKLRERGRIPRNVEETDEIEKKETMVPRLAELLEAGASAGTEAKARECETEVMPNKSL
jgi:hypothetical protein